MSARPPKKPSKPLTEYQSIAAQFAAAKKAREEEQATGRLRDEKVKQRNAIARRNFKYQHGLLVTLLLCFFYLHGVGLFLFTKGFLLTRLVLDHKSECAVSPLQEYGDAAVSNPDNGCWHPKTFNKAVVVIIDALRYDFTVPYVPKDNTSYPHHFHNVFTTPYEIASKHPENAVLLPFIADPPTTTLQRLKGLTTGTLPTFIDAGSNFAGTAIDEDNVIAQLKARGKRMAFMGDDTWMALFPGLFENDMNYPYESLNVWDLHTVDNGVNEHIFPLLEPRNSTKWDVLFAHYLGVDHAGHRYGPDHFAMAEKLKQMDDIVQRLVDSIDNETLLIVMGDHGMDSKGDHGGESQSELEAALWMYSKRPVFGRLPKELLPQEGQRAVAQIDLVPTLSLLLGAPIPFNNLGAPIAEPFLGRRQDMRNLAAVSRLTAAQIKRYQREYFGKNDRHEDLEDSSLVKISWEAGQKKWASVVGRRKTTTDDWIEVYREFATYQQETLRICKSLWARFDLISMGAGITVLLGSILCLAIYARGFVGDNMMITDVILKRIRNGLSIGTAVSLPAAFALSEKLEVPKLHAILFGTAVGIILGFLSATVSARQRFASILPSDGWGFLSLLFTLLNSIMFGSNSFTIWEDKALTYFIATFAIASFVASRRNEDPASRVLGTYHSIMLLLLARLASVSRLCREEQMPFCHSTFYASATSSVSAPWTLALLFGMALVLPSIVRSFYTGTKSYSGPAPFYIGWAFRLGLFLVATYWTLDSADNGSWFPEYAGLIKAAKPVVAQIVLAMAFIAGHVGFAWSSLCLDIDVQDKEPNPAEGKKITAASGRTVTILGYANVHGSRYFLLVICWALALILLQKPMGALSMGILLWQILTVLEIIDVNNLSSSSIGPVMFAILGNAHFFSTGHQATLASIQWDAAFIPLATIRYPWSPLLIVGNTLGPQILTAIAVPLVALWKAPPKKEPQDQEGLMSKVARAAATYVLFQASIAGASMLCAGWLRRHLMLYRIFSPRFMLAAVTLIVAELACVLIGVGAVRWNWEAVGEVFGYS
jgi:phosphatidylinositol glycan class O